MKATGIVRKLDHLGRVVLPAELRRTTKIGEKDCVELFVDGDSIVLRKYDAAADLEQILENTEKSIRLQDYLEPDLTPALLAKVEEMKAIVANGRK